MEKQIEDKGLPAPPRGSSEELQHSNYLQIPKYFTPALLVLLVTNIISCKKNLNIFAKLQTCQEIESHRCNLGDMSVPVPLWHSGDDHELILHCVHVVNLAE